MSAHATPRHLAGARPRGATLAVLALVAACAKDDVAPTAQVPQKTVQKAKAAPSKESPSEPAFSYSPVGKRDPFYSYLAELQATTQMNPQRRREATETFELDQYRLTGVVTGTSQPRAMVEDPENKGHEIRIGTRLGKRGGVVTRISNDGLMVTEEFHTPSGDLVRVPINVKLPQPELEIGARP